MSDSRGQDQEAVPSSEGEDEGSAVRGVARFDGQDYPLEDLSKSGFLAGSYRGPRARGDSLDVQISFTLDGRPRNLDCKAFVVRTDLDKHHIAGVFFGMTEGDRLVISRYADLKDTS